MSLTIRNLIVSREGTRILHGVNLEITPGRIHALMGPNGSGKSTLASALMGHPKYTIESGNIFLDGTEITALPTHERAKNGIFLSLQQPPEIEGVALSHFLRTAHNAHTDAPTDVYAFRATLHETMKKLGMDSALADRSVNAGFSGGEKKRSEILQLMMLKPRYAILDEPDSGLDVDALRATVAAISSVAQDGAGILLITHSTKILAHLAAQDVSVLIDGRIARIGGNEVALDIEKSGYASL